LDDPWVVALFEANLARRVQDCSSHRSSFRGRLHPRKQPPTNSRETWVRLDPELMR
jgi:hypothetical protein